MKCPLDSEGGTLGSVGCPLGHYDRTLASLDIYIIFGGQRFILESRHQNSLAKKYIHGR